MAANANWAKSLRGEPPGGLPPPGPTGIVGKFNRTRIGRNTTVNSPIQTSKTAKGRSRSPDKPVKAPVVRRSSGHGSYGYNSRKQSLASKTSSTTVIMEGREEVIEVHLPLKPPKFEWRVNDEKAYFELGTPADNDDQYTINITTISASYLHLLGPDQSNKENCNWSIEYKAFDCHISSDPFQLSTEDEIRRTYIGDKAKANIRASGGLFSEYLRHTTIEFHVIQIGEGEEKDVGVACLDLKELTKPNVNQLKYILEVISTDADVNEIPPETRPEIRVLVQLDTEPNFFKPEGSTTGITMEAEKVESDVIPEPNRNSEISVTDGGGERKKSKTKSTVTFQDDVLDSAASPPQGEQLDKNVESEEDNEAGANVKEVSVGSQKFNEAETSEAMLPHLKSNLKISPSKGGGDDVRSTLSSDFESNVSPIKNREYIKSREKSPVTLISPSKTKSLTPSPSKRMPSLNVTPERVYRAPEKTDELQDATISLNSSDSLTESFEAVHPSGHQLDIVKAGNYRVTIQFSSLRLQSREPLQHNLELSYIYPPLGIVDKPIVCTAKPQPSAPAQNERDRLAIVYDGRWGIVIALNRLADDLLQTPIVVAIRNASREERRTNTLYTEIPFGNVFFQELRGRKRILTGQANVLKTKGDRKVGELYYTIKVESIENSKLLETIRPNAIATNTRGLGEDEDLPQHTRLTLEKWKILQQEEFKKELREKEAAYLRILSEEWKKRDQEREALLFEKVQNLERDKREVEKQKRYIQEKEGSLKALENEVKISTIKHTSEQAQVLETTKFKIRQLENEHKHEVELLQKRFLDSVAEFEKVKGKVLILENKLRNKDDDLTELLQSRNKWPDVEITMRLDALEKQNDILRDQLMEARRDSEKYKREANTLCHQLKFKQKEQDARLHDENERLRLQLFAKDQKFEMGQDRQSVKELSDKIKKMLDDKGGGTYTLSKATGPPVTRHIDLHQPPPSRSPNIQHQSRKGKDMNRVNQEKRLEMGGKGKPIQIQTQRNMDNPECIEKEIQRLLSERVMLLGSGSYTPYDIIVRSLENQITKLASRLTCLNGDD